MVWYRKPATGADELVHGYTLADVGRCARIAAGRLRGMATSAQDRYDFAYSAITVHLYSAPHRPPEHELIMAGVRGVYDHVHDEWHHHGHRKTPAGYDQAGTMPMFAAYWGRRVTPSHEDRIIDQLAVRQILETLTPPLLAAVQALAATDNDYRAAALALGIKPNTQTYRIKYARKHFFDLWHEGEAPTGIWARGHVSTKGLRRSLWLRSRTHGRKSVLTPEAEAACCPDRCDECSGCAGPCHSPDEPMGMFVDHIFAGDRQ